ncbi:MAG: nicotinate-nucleotide adenylyltransferase [candidate division Zixibacteria bacterium]|nr:nicotinate-nucleotide adenylyltransferase [candidate division Zixibacteria bacterium]
MSKRLGILGGAFDPVHYGHLLLAAEASHQLQLQRVLFIPTYHSAHQHKEIETSYEHRYAMLQLALSDHHDFDLSDIERHLGGVSYTVKTLERLKAQLSDTHFFFIIGADNLVHLDSWHQPEELVKLATLAVATRPGYTPKLPDLDNVTSFPMPLIEISASIIRERASNGIPIRLLVPRAVEDYITGKGLYQ